MHGKPLGPEVRCVFILYIRCKIKKFNKISLGTTNFSARIVFNKIIIFTYFESGLKNSLRHWKEE